MSVHLYTSLALIIPIFMFQEFYDLYVIWTLVIILSLFYGSLHAPSYSTNTSTSTNVITLIILHNRVVLSEVYYC